MRKFILAAVVAFGFLLGGCGAIAPYQPGGLYTSYDSPRQATQNAVGAKTGKACQTNILGMIATGDASIQAAANKGGVSKIATVDTHFQHILGIFSKTCTRVSGK